jgi:formate dehydrogenase
LDESTIYIRLAAASGVGLFGSRLVTSILNGITYVNKLISRGRAGFPQRWLLNRILRHNGQPDFATLVAHPDGYPWQGARPGSFLAKRVTTDSGRVQLAPSEFLEELRSAATPQTRGEGHRFQLITKRRHNTHNSWTQNVRSLTRGENEQTNVIYMHPVDIESLGIEEGAAVDIASSAGEIRLPVEALATLQRGVVAVPHGWGHQHARGLSVASGLRGANVNILAADGPEAIEPLSGMARLSAVPVSVSKAAGPIDPASWSGR